MPPSRICADEWKVVAKSNRLVTITAGRNAENDLHKNSVAAFGRKPHFLILPDWRRSPETPLRRRDRFARVSERVTNTSFMIGNGKKDGQYGYILNRFSG